MMSARFVLALAMLVFTISGGVTSGSDTTYDITPSSEHHGSDITASESIQEDYNSTDRPRTTGPCKVEPKIAIGRPGGNVEFRCICHNRLDNSFPEWRRVNNVAHSHEQTKHGHSIITSLRLINVSSSSPKRFACADIKSNQEAVGSLDISKNSYLGFCNDGRDCLSPYSCINSACNCSSYMPIFISGSLNSCYPVVRLEGKCTYGEQCASADKRSYCRIEEDQYVTSGFCTCKAGFVSRQGKCARKASYLYTCFNQYKVVWWVLLAFIPILICASVLRLVMVRRRMGPQRQRLESFPSQEQINHPEKPKLRF